MMRVAARLAGQLKLGHRPGPDDPVLLADKSPRRPHGRQVRFVLMALTFSTLLSSQGSDAPGSDLAAFPGATLLT